MQVLHTLGDVSVSKNVARDVAFLLGNKNCGYVYFSTGKNSRYEGVFLQLKGRLYRVVAHLGLGKKPDKIVNRFHSVETHSLGNKEKFFMPDDLNSAVYELEKADWVDVSLDVRESYDTSGSTSYEILKADESITVRCNKKGSEFFVSIRAENPEYEVIGRFDSVLNERDQERNSPPYEMPVYRALRIKSKIIVISFSDDRETAVNESDYVFKNLEDISRKKETHFKGIRGKAVEEKIQMAYNCCINSLDQLTASDRILAGLPWFFQSWTRDELISLKNVEDKLKRTILLRDLGHVLDDGRIPNIIPNSDVGSADAVGWLFKRIGDSLYIFNSKERNFSIKDGLIESVMRLNESHVKDLLVYNKPKETWMDSYYKEDGREGARIEIQALLLCMYSLGYRLTRNWKFQQLEQFLREKIKERFWDNNYLKDGLDDSRVRPNVFIAAYLYPELLTREEWVTCFENILPKLWCVWGGLSTIDKEDPLYCKHSTGEDPRSYHHGDSWYFLNNMAALVLHRTDPNRFQKYIDAIVAASTEDILWQGMIAHHSEISSAAEQRAEGCGAQAWSAAMYIEMVNELFSK